MHAQHTNTWSYIMVLLSPVGSNRAMAHARTVPASTIPSVTLSGLDAKLLFGVPIQLNRWPLCQYMGVVTTIFHEFRLVSEQQTEGFRTWGVDYYHILGSRTIVRPVGINTEGWTALEILNEFPAQLSSNRHFTRHFFQTLVPLYSSWTVSFSVERTEQYSTGKMNVQFAFFKSVFMQCVLCYCCIKK